MYQLGSEKRNGKIEYSVNLRASDLKKAKEETEEIFSSWQDEFIEWENKGSRGEFISKVIPSMGEGDDLILTGPEGSYIYITKGVWEFYEGKEDSKLIVVEQEFRIPGTDVIVENGDRIKVLSE